MNCKQWNSLRANDPKQIGPKKAREMWFLARFYSSSEAEKMGLVNAVVPVSFLSSVLRDWTVWYFKSSRLQHKLVVMA